MVNKLFHFPKSKTIEKNMNSWRGEIPQLRNSPRFSLLNEEKNYEILMNQKILLIRPGLLIHQYLKNLSLN